MIHPEAWAAALAAETATECVAVPPAPNDVPFIDVDTVRDERELAWWRMEFAPRFRSHGLPRVGSCFGWPRFVIMVETEDGLVPWTEWEGNDGDPT